MEVKPGYKQTEVGVIPADWEVAFIGDEFAIQLGKMLDSEKNIGVPKLFLGNRAVQWGQIDLGDIGFIKLTPSDLQRFRLRDGDLLVCEGGEIGRAAIWHQPIAECYYQKALHRLRPKRGYNVTLMLYVLQRLASTGVLLNFVTQTSIAHLPKNKFEKIPIPLLPTKAEQEAIAEALSDTDALIESLEQLLAKKRNLKQGAMQELLTGKKRLPGFSGKWEVTVFGSVAERIVGGGTPSRAVANYWSGDVPWMTVKDFACHSRFGTLENITNEGLKNSASHLIPKHTLITSTRMALGKAVVFEVDVTINQDLKAIFPKKDTATQFLYYWFQFNESRIVEMGSGSTVMGLSLGDLRKIPFSKPPLPEQTAIAAILSDMDAEIAALETKLTKAHQLKQGMMQELLTGRVRLIN
ncbi:MAG: restriction endonuclease subunit S [Nitrospiraceae bacterium]